MGTPPDELARLARTGRVASEVSATAKLDGTQLRTLISDACALLQRHIDALNAINVFPIPDGDTGTNMHLTLRAGVAELARTPAADVAEAMRALAHGALMGARGNSGVILSQVLRGCASALEGRREADGAALADAFSAALDAAYEALTEPKEGTILTVVREVAEALSRERPATVEGALACAVAAANGAVARTPELLPVLKEAGVVDAGALGLAIILEGMLRSLRGDPLDVNLAPQSAVEAGWRSEAATLHQAEHGESGYCTEFIASGRGIDSTAVRAHLTSLGTSLLIVGDDDLLRVHLHTADPDAAIAYGRSLGELSQVKVDNLEAQIEQFVSQTPLPPMTGTIDVVAVAAGDGIEAAFRSLGVTHLVHGGQTMNPSAGEILDAIEACMADQVVVLPNNGNIIAAAQQAATQSAKRVAVVPSRSIPQGVAAVLTLNRDLPFEDNAAAMERSLSSVRSAEVARALRSTTIAGRRVEVGQAIGLIDGVLSVVADDLATAVQQCAQGMLTPEASLLTLYAGAEVREEDGEALAEALRKRYPSLEIDLVRGGQPHYPYIISLE